MADMKGRGIAPGCMVMLTKATLPENVGKIGTVVEVFKEHTPHGRMWTVQFSTPIRTMYQEVSSKDFRNVRDNGSNSVVQHPETWMKRIDGDPDDHWGEEDTMKPRKTVGELMKEYQTGFSKVPA